MGHILLFAGEVHPRCCCHKTLVVMALVVCLTLSPLVVYLITVRAVICPVVRHIANSSASSFCHSMSLLPSVFDTDPLCLCGRNQWYPVDAAIDEPLMEVWLLLP